MLTISL
ncbi:hypothetical protein YPPY63_0650, partial [Yersinia pestis PY-63]